MSAYGAIRRSQLGTNPILPPTTWVSRAAVRDVIVYHLRRDSALQLPGLIEYLHEVFSKVLEEGMTYPQEGDMDRVNFESYFFAEDVFLGISTPTKETGDIVDGVETTKEILGVKGDRSWEEAIAGYYYVSDVSRLPCSIPEVINRSNRIILAVHPM